MKSEEWMDQGRPSLQLKPLHVHGSPTVTEIPEGGLTIGRDASNAIVLDGNAYPQVSAYHSRVSVLDHELILEDLGSKNGTFVNDRRIERRALRVGDVLQLGGSQGPRFVVVDPSTDVGETIMMGKPATPPNRESLSASRIIRLKRALGIPRGEGGVGTMVRTH